MRRRLLARITNDLPGQITLDELPDSLLFSSLLFSSLGIATAGIRKYPAIELAFDRRTEALGSTTMTMTTTTTIKPKLKMSQVATHRLNAAFAEYKSTFVHLNLAALGKVRAQRWEALCGIMGFAELGLY